MGIDARVFRRDICVSKIVLVLVVVLVLDGLGLVCAVECGGVLTPKPLPPDRILNARGIN